MKLVLSKYMVWIIISLVFSTVSFWAGYYKAVEGFICDPFRIIREEHKEPAPAIDSLLKKTNP